jgi:predicted dinucleotide-binding enzyme
MKIGILGTGDVGRTLANAFLATGHQVMMGSREAANEKALAWAKEAGAGSVASVGTFADAAKFAEVVVLAVSWSGAENAVKLAGAETLAGKVVIDAINPLTF